MFVGIALLSISSLVIPNAAMAEDWCPDSAVASVLIDVPFAVFNALDNVSAAIDDRASYQDILNLPFVPC